MKKTVFFLALLLLTQCKANRNKQEVGDIVEIDVSRTYPTKELYLQDIAKVEYIPLETNDNTLMKLTNVRIHVSDDYIITTNRSEGDFFVFDGKGKSKYSFNHRGQGPREYNIMGSFAFDEKAKEIFVFDRYSSSRKILVYAEDGEYKRALSGFPDLKDIILYNFDETTLLVYDNSNVLGQGVLEQEIFSNKPYLLLSKDDGSIVDILNIHLPLRVSDAVVWQDGQNINLVRIPITNNRSFGKNFLITDWSSDTIYSLTPYRELQPMIVRKPPVQETDPKILISNFLVTDKFILLGVYTMDYQILRNNGNISSKQLMYDFKNGQINEFRLKNRDITSSSSVRMWEATTPENIGVSIYDAFFLFGLDEKNEIKGDLKELLKSLDEEDNPVIMKITF